MTETINALAEIDTILGLLAHHPSIDASPELTAGVDVARRRIAELQTELEVE